MQREYATPYHRWFEEVWNQGRAETIDELLAPDCVMHGLTADGSPTGITEFKEFFVNFRVSFPDIRVEVLETAQEGDLLAGLFRVTATHQADRIGIRATGRQVLFTGQGFSRLRDGKFIEVWNHFDFMGMYAQLGALTLNFDAK